ncbi:RNA polymerase sigma factor [Arthrobacter sp. 35W]|uniref:RNA polymerase sigma factor n=1 Tax=Arthrobacter sp. 35W TaxID=1132441 RepID=UPI00040F5911|nr:sigma factor [Arthrobacter sp. 35W]
MYEAVKTMGLKSKPAESTTPNGGVDASLTRPPVPDIPTDQLMLAVESTRPYVCARLRRLSRLDDVDDVMQDIRLAAWDGLARQRYREFPGVSFAAWVQGIAGHLCAEFIRREMSHMTLPLMFDAETAAVSPVDFAPTESMDRVAEREWVGEVLEAARRHVSEETWDLAVHSLTTPRDRMPAERSDADDRRRWHAVTVLRQTALTIKAAFEVEMVLLGADESLNPIAVGCLPNPLLRLVAERLVLTGVSGPARTQAIAELSAEVGVSVRYIEVKIGHARNLYNAARDVLERAGRANWQGEIESDDDDVAAEHSPVLP